MVTSFWEPIWHIGAAILGLAIAYGAFRYMTRNRANDPVTEEATREQYDDPNLSKREEERLRRKLR